LRLCLHVEKSSPEKSLHSFAAVLKTNPEGGG
jgi:hypothetical protein